MSIFQYKTVESKNKNYNPEKDKKHSGLAKDAKKKNKKKDPKKFIIGTYKYSLTIINTEKNISGFIEGVDLLDAENKLKTKYNFDPKSLKLKKEKEFTLDEIFEENNYFKTHKKEIALKNQLIKTEKDKKKKEAKEKLKNAIKKETISKKDISINKTDSKNNNKKEGEQHSNTNKNVVDKSGNVVNKFVDILTSGQKKEDNNNLDKKVITIDYKRIIQYEERLKKLEEEAKKNKIRKVSDAVEQKIDKLQKSLLKLQFKIEKGSFNKDDNIKINKLKKLMDEFEKRVHTVMEKLSEKGETVPTRIQRVGRKALSLIDELDESKKGNIPPHVKEKVKEIKLKEEQDTALKISEQTKKIEDKIKYLHQLLPDIDNEIDVKKLEKKIMLLEKALDKNRHNPILVKYYPHLADPEMVRRFKGLEHTISLDTMHEMAGDKHSESHRNTFLKRQMKVVHTKKKKKKNISFLTKVKKYGFTGALQQMRIEFVKKGGVKGLFDRTRNSILGRKVVDILDEGSQKLNKIDDITLTDSQAKMKSKFNFRISEKERKKMEEKENKIIKGAKPTGQFFKDFFNMLNDFLIDIGKVKVKEKAVFYRLLAVMVSAGIPLIKSLHELVKQQKNPKFKKVLYQLTKSIEGGASLSRSMLQYPDVFEESVIGMIKSGEVSGTLPQILRRIAENIEKSAALTGKVKGAMMYPIVLMFVLTGCVTAILVFVLPQLMPIFAQSGTELPMTTKSLIFASDLLKHQGHYVVLSIVVLIIAFKQFHKTYEGKFYVDIIKLKIPIFGRLTTNMLLAKFNRTLSSLTSSGLSIIKSLKINAESIGNEVYKIEILEVADRVKLGHTIGETLDGNSLFPNMLVNMIKVGEESAALGDVTERLAKFYEEETDEMVKNLTTLMEPIIITTLAVVVGFIMMAVMQPILSLTENIG